MALTKATVGIDVGKPFSYSLSDATKQFFLSTFMGFSTAKFIFCAPEKFCVCTFLPEADRRIQSVQANVVKSALSKETA